MGNTLTVALVQSQVVWEDAETNRLNFSRKIDSLQQGIDLIVLPEMFSTGFTMSPQKVAESMGGETISWMKRVAQEHDCAITGCMVIKEDGRYFNRLLFVVPSGEISYYDKRHLFSLAGEDEVYTAGTERLQVDFRGFKICLLICYDLRFPAFSRNTTGYDLLVYVANWPETRILAWDTLLKARAIENMCYVVGVNRLGEDVSGKIYPGHSQVVDCLGEELLFGNEEEGIYLTEIAKPQLLEIRKKFNFLNDRDEITVN